MKVANNNDVTAKDTQMSSFDEYWNRCKKGNLYIVGNTEYICLKSNTYLWTGLRKYIIGIYIKYLYNTHFTCQKLYQFFMFRMHTIAIFHSI